MKKSEHVYFFFLGQPILGENTAMTNVNLSYAREVLRYKFTGEDDFQERNIRISIFRRPVGKGEKGLGQNPQLPNVSFCMHWGVWVEFDGTKEGLGRCIYTFDADIHKKDNVDLCKSTDWSTHMKALFAGDFTVTGFEFFPDLKVQVSTRDFIFS